jgi:hypothetical protein
LSGAEQLSYSRLQICDLGAIDRRSQTNVRQSGLRRHKATIHRFHCFAKLPENRGFVASASASIPLRSATEAQSAAAIDKYSQRKEAAQGGTAKPPQSIEQNNRLRLENPIDRKPRVPEKIIARRPRHSPGKTIPQHTLGSGPIDCPRMVVVDSGAACERKMRPVVVKTIERQPGRKRSQPDLQLVGHPTFARAAAADDRDQQRSPGNDDGLTRCPRDALARH